MIKKTLPLCVALVMMVAGIAQATEWPHVSFTLPTDTWGDLTFHQTDLDQVGNDVTTGGNTYALDGWDNWAGNIGQWPLEEYGQWDPRTPAYESAFQGKMDAAAYVLQVQPHPNHSTLVTEIAVAEDAYDVFVVYLVHDNGSGSIYAATGLVSPMTNYAMDGAEIVDWDVNGEEGNRWNAVVTKIGTVIGSTVTVRASNANDDGSEYDGWCLYWGVCIRPAFKEIIVEPVGVEITEGDAAATVTVALTDEPASDVTITVTPGVHGMDYALNTEDPNDPVDLVFTAADWAAKTLTITPVDDVEIEDYREEDQLALSIITSDPCYATRVLPAIDVDIIDNEQAYEARTFSVNTPSWGDLTVHQIDLDQVGNDIVPGGNTRAADGTANWASDIDQWPLSFNAQWNPRAAAYTPDYTGQMDPLDYMHQASYATGHPKLITEVDVPEDTYDVFVVYLSIDDGVYGEMHSGIYASVNETGPLTPYKYDNGDIVDTSASAPEPPTWHAYVAHVGQVTGSQLTLRVGNSDINDQNNFAYCLYAGLAYRKAPWVVTQSSGSTAVSENGATDTIEFQLMVEPASDVTVDVAVDAAQLTVTPAQLVFPVATWNTPQSVTVGAVDDAVLEADPHSSVLTYASDSADPNDALSGSALVEIAENECGAWGFNPMDFDADCDVDLADLATFAAHYLICTRPDDPACVDLR